MSIFGFYFVTGLLREAGWPRRKGFFNSTAVIDTTMLDAAIDQMIDWAAALGAGHPQLALQTFGEMFRDRDWSGDDRPNIKKFIESARAENESWRATSGIAPNNVVQRTRFAGENYHRAAEGILKKGSRWKAPTMAVKEFKELRLPLEHWFLEGLLWGLANPEAFEAWYQADYHDKLTSLPQMRDAGLAVDPIPDLAECLANSEEILRNYERDIGPLPAIPASLLLDGQALGCKAYAGESGIKTVKKRPSDVGRALRSLYDETFPRS